MPISSMFLIQKKGSRRKLRYSSSEDDVGKDIQKAKTPSRKWGRQYLSRKLSNRVLVQAIARNFV